MTEPIKPVAFLVEGKDENGKVISRQLHFNVEDVRRTASVFAQHYPVTHSQGLNTADQLREARLDAIKARIECCINRLVYDVNYSRSNLLAIDPETILKGLV